MSDTVETPIKIETESELFDILAKYGISTVIYEFTSGWGYRECIDTTFIYKDDDDTEIPDEVGEAIREAVDSFGHDRSQAITHGDYDAWEKYGHVGEKYFMGSYDEDGCPTITFDVSARKIILDGDVKIKEVYSDHITKTWEPDAENHEPNEE